MFTRNSHEVILKVSEGYIHTEDNGQSWNLVLETNNGGYFGTVLFEEDKWYYFLLIGQVFISTDKGQTWTQTGQENSLIDFGVGAVDIDFHTALRKDDFLIISLSRTTYNNSTFGYTTIRHQFISNDDGVHWTPLDLSSFNNLQGNSFSPQFIKNDAVYFSEGKGLWKISIDDLLEQIPEDLYYGIIEGQVIIDKEDNCIVDSTDCALAEQVIEIIPGPFYTLTDANGFYSVALPAGEYQIITTVPQYHEIICVDSVYTNVVVDSFSTIENIDFLIHEIPGIQDLEIILTGGNAVRPGFEVPFTINVTNKGTETLTNIPVKLMFDENILEYLFSNPNGTIDNNQVEWSLASIAPQESFTFTADFKVFPNVELLGEELVVEANAFVANDINQDDNSDEFNIEVTGSYDPNDKQDLNDRTYLPGEQPIIDYLIRFQNTGTDTAFTVVVTDTLSEDLNILSLRTISTSHPYHCELSNDRVMTWTFNNILLPDSTTNETASHGYIRFSLTASQPFENGDAIQNTAEIYFDFNPAIITNTVNSLAVKDSLFTTLDINLCYGDFYEGISYIENATLIETLEFVQYDSIITTNINILPISTFEFQETICEGESYSLAGETYTSTGIYEATFSNYLGCDSLVTLDLKVLNNIETSISYSMCEGETYIFDGQEYSETGIHTSNFTAQNGCDSLVTLELEVLEKSQTNISHSMCEGDTYFFNGEVYNQPGIHEALLSAQNGCDSLVTLDLEVIEVDVSEMDVSICHGGSFSINNFSFDEAGSYNVHIPAGNGCYNIVYLTITTEDILTAVQQVEICEGDTYEIGDSVYEEAGLYIDMLTTNEGCDSIVTTSLSLIPPITTTLQETIIIGEIYNGVVIENDTLFIETYVAQNNCDSIVYTYVTAELNTAISNLESDLQLQIFPNPFEDNFVIELELKEAGTLNIELYNNLGQRIKVVKNSNSFPTEQHQFKIETSDLPSGSYWIKIQLEDGVIGKKIIKM